MRKKAILQASSASFVGTQRINPSVLSNDKQSRLLSDEFRSRLFAHSSKTSKTRAVGVDYGQDNSFQGAFNLGDRTGRPYVGDDDIGFTYLNRRDTADWYTFTKRNTTSFSVRLTGMVADADLYVVYGWSGGRAVEVRSNRAGNRDESVTGTNSRAGTVTAYIQVAPYGSARTRYRLVVQ